MSKSVDDAVCDYFSLLLNEPQPKPVIDNKITQSHYGQSRLPQTIETDERLSRQALEQLFARSPKENGKLVEEVCAKEAVSVEAISDIDCIASIDCITRIKSTGNNTNNIQETKIEPLGVLEADRQIEPAGLSDSQNALDIAPQVNVKSAIEPLVSTQTLLEQLDDEFQVLFFKVAGLTLAVPLVSLGGIVGLEKITRLMGRPQWYMGVQQYRETQLNVVDTCAWVMPEKYDEKLVKKVNYQYVVVLEDSHWGLGCESLIDAITIKKSEVNWRSQAGKRPWLAGVVKEQMCGILNVEALVQMLGSGLGCQDPLT
ncbi:CheW protein [Shewanella halifaxensis HAW-EB4]|uniref:CheW protein n=1 Tax=Shewanella halifaxensis (strain HAW-EB4) TaxID=458817 RepID=B0TMG9_SHEHH|nr:chemotaxis protein CheW [Shewanella halifaxensis]ABZ76038.1 CheW protein [Shewanella halifaxensis HAW-EB4]